jgi:hypothetical protein
MNEFPPAIPEYIEGDLESFRRTIQNEMGNDEHAKNINFEELTEHDRELYELYRQDNLGIEQIKQASNEAKMSGARSSGFFRGWLANMVGIRILREEMKKRRSQK